MQGSKGNRQLTDLLHVADLEASFRLDADQRTTEDEPSLVLAINSATELICRLQTLTCQPAA